MNRLVDNVRTYVGAPSNNTNSKWVCSHRLSLYLSVSFILIRSSCSVILIQDVKCHITNNCLFPTRIPALFLSVSHNISLFSVSQVLVDYNPNNPNQAQRVTLHANIELLSFVPGALHKQEAIDERRRLEREAKERKKTKDQEDRERKKKFRKYGFIDINEKRDINKSSAALEEEEDDRAYDLTTRITPLTPKTPLHQGYQGC